MEIIPLFRQTVIYSRWTESRALEKANTGMFAKVLSSSAHPRSFKALGEEMVCRHSICQNLVVDGGLENEDLVKGLAEKYNIRRGGSVCITIPQRTAKSRSATSQSEMPSPKSVCKAENQSDCSDHLDAVPSADRTSIRTSTGLTPYEIELSTLMDQSGQLNSKSARGASCHAMATGAEPF
ncbi:hypothetical protein AYO21_11176 [Fonsecaea monophora]|uniref:Uncharacterized protein n=1 Tax=Fonsecaea monophora TaxID=254056 RepID=A0A177ERM5_9EURO|nr:hypothetical protein AYO21_11176 [Fonsecaea monophora]OAG34664.1 hypothetical protein AYO21_11176 [Fonsecaea monophora]